MNNRTLKFSKTYYVDHIQERFPKKSIEYVSGYACVIFTLEWEISQSMVNSMRDEVAVSFNHGQKFREQLHFMFNSHKKKPIPS